MFTKLFNKISNTAADFIDNPIKKSVEVATQPIRDLATVVDGLTEGELRLYASTRLGADIVSGMALSEIIEWYNTL